jgi:hypothetical protein
MGLLDRFRLGGPVAVVTGQNILVSGGREGGRSVEDR